MNAKPHWFVTALLACAQCGAATVIPIEIEKGNPIAQARINGVPVRLVVDSGGGVVALKAATLKAVAATPTGTTRDASDAFGNSSTQPLFTLDELELGGNTFANLEAAETGKYVSGSPGDGILGRYFLNRFLVVYDYAAKKITLFSPEERSRADLDCGSTRIPTIADADAVIVSKAKTDHREMTLLWDTGATYSFVKKSFAERHRLPVEEPLYTSQRFVMSEQDFGPLQFVVLDIKEPANVDGYLGFNFFMSHVVCIDAMRHEIRVRKH